MPRTLTKVIAAAAVIGAALTMTACASGHGSSTSQEARYSPKFGRR